MASSSLYKVGLITGCFDVIHIGHIKLFQYAKKYVDYLVVGLEADVTIQKTKKGIRPVNKLTYRRDVLKSIKYIDKVILLENPYNFTEQQSEEYYLALYKRVKPTHLISSSLHDKYFNNKVERANKFGIKIIDFKKDYKTSSTDIINKILSQR